MIYSNVPEIRFKLGQARPATIGTSHRVTLSAGSAMSIGGLTLGFRTGPVASQMYIHPVPQETTTLLG